MEKFIAFPFCLFITLIVFTGILNSYKQDKMENDFGTIMFSLLIISICWSIFYYLNLSN